MPATINGTTGFGGNLSGNVTGNVAGNVTGNSDSATKLSTASGDAPSFACRAWVNFDASSVTNVGGEDRCAIRASGNVTKVVRNGTADFTVTFTAALLDANYVVCQSAGDASLTALHLSIRGTPTTTTVRLWGGDYGTSRNPTICSLAVFR